MTVKDYTSQYPLTITFSLTWCLITDPSTQSPHTVFNEWSSTLLLWTNCVLCVLFIWFCPFTVACTSPDLLPVCRLWPCFMIWMFACASLKNNLTASASANLLWDVTSLPAWMQSLGAAGMCSPWSHISSLWRWELTWDGIYDFSINFFCHALEVNYTHKLMKPLNWGHSDIMCAWYLAYFIMLFHYFELIW